MQVSVTILVENTAPTPGLLGEYGFAAVINIDGKSLLFDTGSDQVLFHNSGVLGINLTDIEEVVISHGHFDHTGALLPLLTKHGPKTVYAHSRLFLPRMVSKPKGGYRQIGTPFSRSELEKAGATFVFHDQWQDIWPGVYISGEIPRCNNFEDTGGDFKVEVNGQIETDYLEDDMALVIDLPAGLVIISGCAHAGFINIINHAIRITGKSKVLAYIGGTHLMYASERRIDQTISILKTIDIDQLVVAHCTGFHAASRLHNELGQRVVKGETGMKFIF